MNSRRVNRLLMFVFLSFAVAIGVSNLGLASSDDTVVAKVNDVSITRLQLNRAILAYQVKAKKRSVTNQEKKDVLQDLIRRQLLLELKPVEELRKDKWVAVKVKEYEDGLIIKRYIDQHLNPQLSVTDEELKRYYDDHTEQFSSPPKVKAAHILLRALEEAQRVKSRLAKGEDFCKLAKEFSIDLASAKECGAMGMYEKGKIGNAEVEKVLFMLGEGEFSDVIQSKYGYHIFRIEQRIPAHATPFENVKEKIRQTILFQKKEKAFIKMMAELKKDANIKIFEDRLSEADQ